MTAQKKSELANWALSALGTIILAMSGWTLLAVIDLKDGVAKLATAAEYDKRDFQEMKEAQRSNGIAHASLQAQIEDLRNQTYKHGW